MASSLRDSMQSAVVGLYAGTFVAAPDAATAARWVDVFQSLYNQHGTDPDAFGQAYRAVSGLILADAISAGRMPPLETLTPQAQITLFYRALLGREPDAEGAAWWLQAMQQGDIARADLMSYLLAAGLQAGGRDAAYVAHRLEVAGQFALSENSNASLLPWLKYDGAAVLEGVTQNPDTMFVGLDKLAMLLAPEGDWRDIVVSGAAANVGIETREGAWFDLLVDTSSATTVGPTGGTLTITGGGILYYDNNGGWSVAANDWTDNDNGKFHFIDADQYGGHLILGWVGDTEADLGVFYGGLSPRVAEVVGLATSRADLVIAVDFDGEGALSSSTVGRTDMILGFDPAYGMQLVGGREPGVAYTTHELTLSDQIITREAALQAAAQAYAQADADLLYFHYVSTTYVYADTNGNGTADATDFLLTLTGALEVQFAAQLQDTGWVG